MDIAIEELPGEITKIVLDGRLDIAGAQAVDLKLNALAGSKKYLLIDLQKVVFLGSMGVRTFISVARTVRSRGGKMAICGPNQDVAGVLNTSGLNTLLSIHGDCHSAIASLA